MTTEEVREHNAKIVSLTQPTGPGGTSAVPNASATTEETRVKNARLASATSK